jgi:hypothetical protein
MFNGQRFITHQMHGSLFEFFRISLQKLRNSPWSANDYVGERPHLNGYKLYRFLYG